MLSFVPLAYLVKFEDMVLRVRVNRWLNYRRAPYLVVKLTESRNCNQQQGPGEKKKKKNVRVELNPLVLVYSSFLRTETGTQRT